MKNSWRWQAFKKGLTFDNRVPLWFMGLLAILGILEWTVILFGR